MWGSELLLHFTLSSETWFCKRNFRIIRIHNRIEWFSHLIVWFHINMVFYISLIAIECLVEAHVIVEQSLVAKWPTNPKPGKSRRPIPRIKQIYKMPKCDAHLGPLTLSSRWAAVDAARRRSYGADCRRLRHGRQMDDSDVVKWCDVAGWSVDGLRRLIHVSISVT